MVLLPDPEFHRKTYLERSFLDVYNISESLHNGKLCFSPYTETDFDCRVHGEIARRAEDYCKSSSFSTRISGNERKRLVCKQNQKEYFGKPEETARE